MNELAKDFEDASRDWKIPEKHDDEEEVQVFTVETDDPEALDKFLEMFGARLIKCEKGTKYQRLGEMYFIYTMTNGPYVQQMVLQNETVGRNIQPFNF